MALILASGALVAACGSSGSSSSASGAGDNGVQLGSSTSTTSGPAVKGGTINVALDNVTLCLDPQVSPQYQTYEIARNVVDSLISKTPGGEYTPWLASSWTVSPDGRHFTFDLRHDVTFSDGTKFDAAVLKENFDRIVAPSTKSQFSAHILAGYTGTTILGPYKAEVNFSTPNVPFLAGASTTYLGIESPASWKKLAPCAPPVGSGPYVATAYTAQQSVTLKRSPVAYRWAPSVDANKSGSAYLDQINFQFVTEDSVRTGGLTSGQFGYIEGVPPTSAESIKSGGYNLIQATQPGLVYGYDINTAQAPLNDINVRKAVSDSIDAAGIVKALYAGFYTQATSLLASSTHGANPAPAPPSTGAAAAEAILNADGWKVGSGGVRYKDGKPLTIKVMSYDPRDQRQQMDVLAAHELQAVGFQVNLAKISLTAANSVILGHQFGLTGQAYILDNPSVLATFFSPASGSEDLSQTNVPAATAELAKAVSTVDPATAATLYTQAEKLIEDNYSDVPIYQLTRLDATSAKLQGVSLDAAAFPYFYNAYLQH